MKRLASRALYWRLAAVFCGTLLAFGAGVGWLAHTAAKSHQRVVVQRISLGLARHIVEHERLVAADGGLDAQSVAMLFERTMLVNPSVEAYLIGVDGRVLAAAPGGAAQQRDTISLAPLQALLDGQPLPVFGDDPRQAQGREVFATAPVVVDGRVAGYLYIVLLGDTYRAALDGLLRDSRLPTMAWFGAVALLLALLTGLLLFAWITRPLQRLTRRVEAFAANPEAPADAALPARGDEIRRLAQAFTALEARIGEQVTELRRQDELRRELVANVSHDLRTPLTAMQNYLETLLRLGEGLSVERRREYLEIATRHSRRVARLSQQLFELAQLECDEHVPEPEPFSAAELLHDIAEKMQLEGQRRGVSVMADTTAQLPQVLGDVGMIERVITNLVDNALRHTPEGGAVRVEAQISGDGVAISVHDTGSGIASEALSGLFDRSQRLSRYHDGAHAGLGLLICSRIVHLHGGRLEVHSEPGQGTHFHFRLACAEARPLPVRRRSG